MKQTNYFFSLLLIAFAFSISLIAQEYDYLDVAPGFETLNKAIGGDTTSTGDPVSLNRVYRLKKDGLYLLNGTLGNVKGSKLRIFAEESDGKIPIVMAAANESGSHYRPFLLEADAHIKGIYLSGRDNLGIYTDDSKDMFRLQEVGLKLELEGCFLEHEWKDFVRMNAENQSVFVTDCILRNGGDLTDASDNQFIDTRGNYQDTILIQNSTLYTTTGRAFRNGDGIFNAFIFDHNTVYQVGNGEGYQGPVDSSSSPIFRIQQVENAKITNNLFIDVAFNGVEVNTYGIDDTLKYPVFGFESIATDEYSDASRNILVANNMLGVTADVQAYYTSMDSLESPVMLNAFSMNRFFNIYDSWIEENNLTGVVQFSDAPTSEKILTYAKYRRDNGMTEVNTPEFWADRNGIGDDPSSWGPADDEFDFDYPASEVAYTAGIDGYPLGDLNWFPERKNDWITDVNEFGNEQLAPSKFELMQNYPNPFNPATVISYSIPKTAFVTIKVYNILGQEVANLLNSQKNAGTYSVTFDATSFTSGVYFYSINADNFTSIKKMMLIK